MTLADTETLSLLQETAEALGSSRVQVDLDALVENYRRLAATVAPAACGVVVKADAYGHGVRRVVMTLERQGAALAAVARVEEGVQLRRAGARLPVLVLGFVEPAQTGLFDHHRLMPSIYSRQQFELWRQALAGPGSAQPVHLTVDTGMSRLGFGLEELPTVLAELRAHPRLELAGFFSHFGDAELSDSPRNPAQEERFDEALAMLTEAERRRTLIHFANSAAGLHRPGSRFGLVRFGIALYGVDPAGEVELEPVMSLHAPVCQVREVPAGRAAGYGSRWVAQRPSRLAVVPVGYGDGYPWRLTHGAEVLMGGRRVPVAGAVSMDLTLLDVTGHEAATGRPVAVGEEVVLLGRQGEELITAVELAERAGTIPWEITCSLGLRLPRRFLRSGELVGVTSRHRGSQP